MTRLFGTTRHNFRRIINSNDKEWSPVGANIQAALDDLPDQGGWVWLPPVSFFISDTIDIAPMQALYGSYGGKGTEITLLPGSDCHMIEYAAPSNVATFIYIGHLTLYGNQDDQAAGDGIHMNATGNAVMDVMIERVWVDDVKGNGFYLRNAWGPRITQCLAEANGQSGFYLTSLTQGYFDGNYSASNGSHGFYLAAALQSMMVTCRADVNGGNGFYLFEGDDLTLGQCIARRNSNHGFYLYKQSTSVVDACISTGVGVQPDGYRVAGVADPNQSLDNIICACVAQGNTNVGVNIVDANCVNTIVKACNLLNNTNGGYTDGGTASIIDNVKGAVYVP